jgi:hypothetical protein
MMIVMALVTTFMTSPVLNLVCPPEMNASLNAHAKAATPESSILKDSETVVV